MMPEIPLKLTVDDIFSLHLWMITNDPDHRQFTKEHFGRDPTLEDLWRHWFETGAAKRFEQLLTKPVSSKQ